MEAVKALEKFSTPATRLALTDIIENENCFYRVRCEAAFCLTKVSRHPHRWILVDTNRQKLILVSRFEWIKVANGMVSNWTGPPAMLMIFRKFYGSFSCHHIVRQNNFANFQHYFLQKVTLCTVAVALKSVDCVWFLQTIPVAMAQLRNDLGVCPPEVLRFLLDLFKYNDNTKNRLSDCWYRAALIEALGNTVSPVVAVVAQSS